MRLLVLTLSLSLPHLVPDALAGATALPTADGWGDTADALPGESITVEADVDVSAVAWAKAYVAQWECAAKQGVYFSGDEDPELIEGLNQVHFDTCVFANRLLRREPGGRVEHYRAHADRIKERLENIKNPVRVLNLVHKARHLLARAWEVEQLSRRAFGLECDTVPGPLVLRFSYGPAGAQAATFPIDVDPNICP